MAMVTIDSSSQPTSRLMAQVGWLGLRVGSHFIRHVHMIM